MSDQALVHFERLVPSFTNMVKLFKIRKCTKEDTGKYWGYKHSMVQIWGKVLYWISIWLEWKLVLRYVVPMNPWQFHISRCIRPPKCQKIPFLMIVRDGNNFWLDKLLPIVWHTKTIRRRQASWISYQCSPEILCFQNICISKISWNICISKIWWGL